MAYLGEEGVPIDQETLDNYVALYGEEKAIGYLQALNDFDSQIKTIIGGPFVEGRGGVRNSGHIVRNKLEALLYHNLEFLEKCQPNLSSFNSIQPD